MILKKKRQLLVNMQKKDTMDRFCLLILVVMFGFFGCSDSKPISYEQLNMAAPIYPDYRDITIPLNIAPLSFYLDDFCEEVEIKCNVEGKEIVNKRFDRIMNWSIDVWHKLLEHAYKNGNEIEVSIAKKFHGKWLMYDKFTWKVDGEIDSYLSYRLIEPGYELWNRMSIIERNLENFDVKPILSNTLTDGSCINCHESNVNNTKQFIIHSRGTVNGTLLVDGDQIIKLDPSSAKLVRGFTYPCWHPDGRYIAFSSNKTAQVFHANSKKQIEVYDFQADLILYDIKDNRVIEVAGATNSSAFENYPTWSRDGKRLFYCVADSVLLPDNYQDVRYKICAKTFDESNAQFSIQCDTIVGDSMSSAVMPSLSPCGRYLLYSKLDYGCFPIWHKESDIVLFDLKTQTTLSAHLNSPSAESYPSWSKSGEWIMFTSRREDELFTRVYFSHFDGTKCSKPFLLPEEDLDIVYPNLKSYNVPQLRSESVEIAAHTLASKLRGTNQKVQAIK